MAATEDDLAKQRVQEAIWTWAGRLVVLAASLVLPIAIYLAGLGMVLPQSIAGAMTPFPERAGAASSLFGFIQQSAAALCGAVVGWLLGENAWPLAAAVATMGCVTLALWFLTRTVRRSVAAKP